VLQLSIQMGERSSLQTRIAATSGLCVELGGRDQSQTITDGGTKFKQGWPEKSLSGLRTNQDDRGRRLSMAAKPKVLQAT
jgi:hypothetical protein